MKHIILTIMICVLSLSSCAHKGNSTEQADKNNTDTNVQHITKAEFLTNVVNYESNPKEWKYLGNKPAIIDFYATWCGPCRKVAPILEELATEYADRIVIYKVDTDKEQELSAAFSIRSIPSILFVPMEGEPQMVQGAMSKTEYKKIIDKFLLQNK